MAVTLGRSASLASGPAVLGVTGVINVTFTEEAETIDITHRGNNASNAAYKVATGGFVTRTWEVECLDATPVVSKVDDDSATSGYYVMSVSENQPLDGPVTYTVSIREA